MPTSAELKNRLNRMTDLRRRVDRQRERLERQADRLDQLAALAGNTRTQIDVVLLQMSAMEQRMQWLEQSVADRTAQLPDNVETRDVLAELRDDHIRIRTRLQLVAAYEERIRRLEDALDAQRRATADSPL